MWRDRRISVPHAALPWMFHNVIDVPCQGGGFLGAAYDPFRITGDMENLNYSAQMFSRSEDLTLGRISDRQILLQQFDGRSTWEPSASTAQLTKLYEKAFALTQSNMVRDAMDVAQESESIRQRYGMGQDGTRGPTNGAENGYGRNLRGQNLLLARRLVEAGIPFVNVYDFK